MSDPEITIRDDRVVVCQGNQTLVTARVRDTLHELICSSDRRPSCGILPKDVRFWCERGPATGVVIEVPPHARTVRWMTDDSRSDFGSQARYRQYFLAFPYVEILVVFRDGALTGFQQLYYRRDALGADEQLLLPNLFNVANAYQQRCWLCLANLRDVARLAWPDKLTAVVNHVFTAAFNRSAEAHEGNSYWGAMRGVDPRVASVDAWQEATRQNPRFPLEVAWKPAETTATAEIMSMLDLTVAPLTAAHATDLVGVVTRAGAGRRGARA